MAAFGILCDVLAAAAHPVPQASTFLNFGDPSLTTPGHLCVFQAGVVVNPMCPDVARLTA